MPWCTCVNIAFGEAGGAGAFAQTASGPLEGVDETVGRTVLTRLLASLRVLLYISMLIAKLWFESPEWVTNLTSLLPPNMTVLRLPAV